MRRNVPHPLACALTDLFPSFRQTCSRLCPRTRDGAVNRETRRGPIHKVPTARWKQGGLHVFSSPDLGQALAGPRAPLWRGLGHWFKPSVGEGRGPGVRGSFCIWKRERSEYVTRLRREPVGSRGRMERRQQWSQAWRDGARGPGTILVDQPTGPAFFSCSPCHGLGRLCY